MIVKEIDVKPSYNVTLTWEEMATLVNVLQYVADGPAVYDLLSQLGDRTIEEMVVGSDVTITVWPPDNPDGIVYISTEDTSIDIRVHKMV